MNAAILTHLAFSLWPDLPGGPAPHVPGPGHVVVDGVAPQHDAVLAVVTVLGAAVTVGADDGGHTARQPRTQLPWPRGEQETRLSDLRLR